MKNLLASSLLASAAAVVALPVQAQLLVDTVADFSTLAQGTNGLEYGYYVTNSEEISFVTDIFSTSGMGTSVEGWDGVESFGTPEINASNQHPGVTNLYPVVRRYTVGFGDELDYSGLVRITGKFGGPIALGGGEVVGFVTIDGVNVFAGSASAVVEALFDFTVAVVAGTRIDFGVKANGSTAADRTFITATVTAIPEPASAAVVLGALAGAAVLGARRRRRCG